MRIIDELRDLASVPGIVRIICRELLRSAIRAARSSRADLTRTPRPLTVGVDVRPFYEPLTGVGWYLWEIMNELAPRSDLSLVAFGDAKLTDEGPLLHTDLPPGVVHRTFDLRGFRPNRYVRFLTGIAHPLLMWLERVDLFFGANYFLPRTMDAIARRRVVTVHDLTYRKHPELLQAETLRNLERHMARELARADAILCVSHATRRDLLEEYEIDASRVITVQNGMRVRPHARHADRLDLPDRYVLFVSTIEPRKNLDLLLDAFELLRDTGRYEGDLVIAGRIGWKAAATVGRFSSSRWAAGIHHMDYVSRIDLDELYRRAEMFILPSHYEGFGFPILEAMAHGVPVITTDVSSLPEVGGDAALYVHPRDVGSLADAIVRVSSDEALRARMIREGESRVARFDWKRAAEETARVFERVGRS